MFLIILEQKNSMGHLKIKETTKLLDGWKKIENMVKKRLNENIKADFIISDFVPEAFELANILKIKSYGVCHFTWDWLYEKILKKKKNLS